MQISEAGIAFICSNEGFSAVPYWDVNGWSWGYGHHEIGGDPSEGDLIANMPISKAQAATLLLSDVAPICTYLNNVIPADCTQNQFDALCDFAYNLGMGSLQTMLAHGWDQVPVQIPYWNHVNHVVNAGLTARRQAEVELFQQGAQQ